MLIHYYHLLTLSDYHTIIDEKISKDKTFVKKRMPFQFRLLIVEPLCKLEKQGKGI